MTFGNFLAGERGRPRRQEGRVFCTNAAKQAQRQWNPRHKVGTFASDWTNSPFRTVWPSRASRGGRGGSAYSPTAPATAFWDFTHSRQQSNTGVAKRKRGTLFVKSDGFQKTSVASAFDYASENLLCARSFVETKRSSRTCLGSLDWQSFLTTSLLTFCWSSQQGSRETGYAI